MADGPQGIDNRPPPPGTSVESGPAAENYARETRARGMGIMYGNFSPGFFGRELFEFNVTRGFCMGEDLAQDERANHALASILKYSIDSFNSLRREIADEPKQGLLIEQYVPPVTQHTEKKGLFKTVEITEPKSFHGKHGENDWVRFEHMFLLAKSNKWVSRMGSCVDSIIVVPPDLANRMWTSQAANPLFMEEYFQQLHQNVVKNDSVHINRKPVNGLIIIDKMSNKNGDIKTVRYPKIVPF